MSVDQSRLDLNTLQWVKSEIDATLKQARAALEAHVESPLESSQLKLITNFLHQVRGTLQMVELYGAAMLAEELELLAGELARQELEGRDDIYEVMMQAMWQLPDYLERLQSGYKDIPMVLLPLLNDLRAARGKPLLSESALFTPDLGVEMPVSAMAGGESLSVLAKKLRHTYHLGLLDWFRERDPKGGLKKLDSVIEQLRESANDPEVNRVLWSASGVIEALNQGGIEASVAVKLLMGQVDRQLKRIIDHGESALADEPPAELEKNLLYYVASASSSGERVNELKKKFKLAEALPDAETLEQARVDLTGPNADLMQTVSTVLLDNLLQVKDALDVLVRVDVKDLSLLPRMADDLSQIADTLGMLGFGKQRKSIQEQIVVLKAIAAGETALEESSLMGVADVLLSIETLLQGNIVKPADNADGQSADEMTAETQQYQLIESVMTEARANMAKVKESLSLYIDMPRNITLITDVPALLDQIRGSFEMLEMPRPAELIAGCRDYVQTAMIGAKRSQDPAQMDALADAISSIEYFMDSVSGQWGNPDSILNVAAERLAFIGIGGEQAAPDLAKPSVSEQSMADTLNNIELAADGVPHTDDTMIDLGSPDFDLAADDSADLMDIDLSDMSTAELSLADFERELAKQGDEDALEIKPEFELDSTLGSMDELSDALSLEDAGSRVENTSNVTQEIDFDSALLELDTPIDSLQDESVIDLVQPDGTGTADDSHEIDFDSALLKLDASIESLQDESVVEPAQAGETADDSHEIDFGSALLKLDASIESLQDESVADLPATRNTSNDTQEIDFDSALLELDSSIEEYSSELAADRPPVENTSNVTQEIEFDDALLEMGKASGLSPFDALDSGLAEIEELTLEPLPEQPVLVTEARPENKLTPPIATAELEAQLDEWYQDAGNKKLSRKLQKDIKSIKQYAKATQQEDIAHIAKDMIAVIKAVQDGESELTDDIRNILQLANVTLFELFNADAQTADADQAVAQDSGPGHVTSVLSNDKPAKTGKAMHLPDEIDEEIIEIFIEEAREEQANISRLLPIWSANPADDESLREMRRSFHTLKGSGRLVGAADIGEFAWAFESMLNRVIDNTVEPGPAMYGLLQQAIDNLPTLLDMFVSGGKPGQETYALMEQAEALSQGKPVKTGTVTAEVDSHDDTDKTLIIELPESGSLVPEMDKTLLDIYRKEVESHLASLHSYIEGWRDDVDRTANQKLIRAVHTLTGCSRTAAVATLAELFGHAEKYFQHLDVHNISVSEESVRLLIGAIDFTEKTIALLDKQGVALPDHQTLVKDIESLYAGAMAGRETAAESNITPLQPIKSKPQASTRPQTDYDDELLSIFLEEATEILDESDQTLHQWSDDKQNPEYITVMQRLLHTLKGGARLAGLLEMGDLSHSIESMLEAIVEGQLEMSEQAYDILLAAQDALVTMLEQVRAKKTPGPADDITGMVTRLLADEPVVEPHEDIERKTEAEVETEVKTEIEAPSETVVEHTDEPTPAPVDSSNVTRLVPDNVIPLTSLKKIDRHEPLRTEEEQLPAERIPARELVRVRSELLDNLVNFAGEVSIYRSRMEQQTNAFRYNLQELDDTVDRLREQLRKFEMEAEAQIQYRTEDSFSHSQEDFDPLEFDRFTQMQQLSRGMMESLNDLDSLRSILAGLTRESETLLVQQSRVNTELQEGLMRTRMVPFSSQANRLRRIVRQTADELGKQAELHLHGADSEIDRTVLERMLPALEHMLRNAVAHGVESPGVRNKTNKSEVGQINLSLTREGADIVLTLSDDGSGIDLAAIQNKAVEKGKLKPDSHVTKEILFDLIMESGFSTADEVTQISGRGVGMDVVNNEIKQLGGLLHIETEQGNGTTFTVSLPLTLSLTRALMVQVGEETYALPLLSVEGVERISTEQLQELYDQEKPVYQWLGQDYPFMHLGSAMGVSQPHVPTDRSRIPLLLVRSGEYRAAVQLDNLIGSREIVVKPVGPQLSTMRGIAGATIMGDGSVVLIIDLGVLIRAAAIQQELRTEPAIAPVAVEQKRLDPVVMVIDDSITVRKVTTRLLERNNYRAVSAKDGVDALAQLQEMQPDLMLLDVEMPRMDGFELATNVRNDEKLKHIPIIMITSRTGQKHRDRADKIGVNVYMGKPFSEGELLENIQTLLDQRH